VTYVDATKVVVEQKSGVKTYEFENFARSNNGTTIIHKPIVKVGDVVKARDVLADGPSMDKGELALGQNVVVAFTTWNGYNFEDAVIVSERVVIDDRFTSIHIDEYTIERRQTKQGKEEITREIPNISEASKKYLDEEGIILVGSEVKVGDVPSRMNIGQVLEIHLGMAAQKLGIKVSTPVFEGVKEKDLEEIMSEAGMVNYGKIDLTDGRTGEKFDKPISVGIMYMLKLPTTFRRKSSKRGTTFWGNGSLSTWSLWCRLHITWNLNHQIRWYQRTN
jgi:DNA-directed RNA polymerase beta subunit